MGATTMATATMVMADVDNGMRILAAKQASGKPSTGIQNQNNLKDSSIFSKQGEAPKANNDFNQSIFS